MRLIYRFSIPVQKGNEAACDGTLAQALKDLVERLKPETEVDLNFWTGVLGVIFLPINLPLAT